MSRALAHRGNLSGGGGFNAGIQVWQEQNTRGGLRIKKIFLPRDCPGHAQREVDILWQLNAYSDYFPRIYHSAIGPNSGHMFLELCGKGTLLALLRNHIRRGKRFPERFVWHVFQSLVRAIYYMHHGPDPDTPAFRTWQRNTRSEQWNWIWHRDLHPGNVFLKSDGDGRIRVMIGDFGSAITRTHTDQFQVRMQALYFALPEPRMNDRSDIYQAALQIVALCCLTEEPHSIVRPNSVARPQWPAGRRYGKALNSLLEKCLRRDPNERISVPQLRRKLHDACLSLASASTSGLDFPQFRIYQAG